MAVPLLSTKLYAPPLRANLIRRPWLTAKLRTGDLRPLTLIAAPAGFGKTTLVSEWLHDVQAQPATGSAPAVPPVAWLALDEDDNDGGRFFAYFLAALRTIAAPDLGETVLALLQSPQPPTLRSILNTLAHELIHRLPPCVLVLDDYHVIQSQPIHETVLFLLERVPALRWIITTRADPPLPLGRLRARQQLLELRAADLRFREGETTQLLNEVMQLALTADSVQELQTKTEGWIAGLQLAGLALQSSPDRTAFTQDFLGSHRYVADYLADEVLNQLPDQTQHFLLRTAILDRMCAELCDALLSHVSTDDLPIAPRPAQLLLEELEQANLFLIPLDGDRRWYRYHHLFADLLRQRLHRRQPQLVVELHRRAASWFAQNELVDDALRHALAGQDFPQAANLLEQSQEALWMQGRFAALRQWLSLLPDPIKAQRPRLLLAEAWTYVLTDAATGPTNALLQQAEEAILQSGASQGAEQQALALELQGVLAAIRAVYHAKQEDPASVIAFAQQALTDLPRHIGTWRSIALMSLGFAYEMSGAARMAQQTLTEAIQLCQQIGNRYSALVATMSLARTQMGQGQLQGAATTYTQGLTQATQQGLAQVPVVAQAYINLGRLNYEWNQLAVAAEQVQRGVAHLQGQGGSWLEFEGYLLLARVNQAQGQLEAARAALHQAEQLAKQLPFQWTQIATAAMLVRARLALGEETDADAWLDQVQATPADELTRVREGEHFTAACVLIAQGRLAEALALLTHLTQVAEAAGRLKVVVESCVLTAVAHARQGERRFAQAALHRALTLAAPEGYLRTFVDQGETMRLLLLEFRLTMDDASLRTYVDRLLRAFDDETSAPLQLDRAHEINRPAEPIQNPKSKIQNLLEPLSARELELLQLMAAGLSNQEIADRLIITLGTVKSHANHIFAKLGVQGRVKAINRARELALL
jgi:LuxR family transcriptional regulator, maltose regulon positive regulatory protein